MYRRSSTQTPSSECLRDPERGWDRSRVKGLLANLVSVRDVSYATALEVVAGGRLYNIVVDTEVGGAVRVQPQRLAAREPTETLAVAR